VQDPEFKTPSQQKVKTKKSKKSFLRKFEGIQRQKNLMPI
jgi:hypothetical protein